MTSLASPTAAEVLDFDETRASRGCRTHNAQRRAHTTGPPVQGPLSLWTEVLADTTRDPEKHDAARARSPMHSAEDLALAESEAQRWCSIALVAGFSPAARQQLIECGLCEELLETPTAELLPLLGRMVAARTLAKQPAALALKPAEVPCERTLTLESRSRASQADASTSASDGGPTVRLIVARYQEDTSWLQSLPPLVEYHVLLMTYDCI